LKNKEKIRFGIRIIHTNPTAPPLLLSRQAPIGTPTEPTPPPHIALADIPSYITPQAPPELRLKIAIVLVVVAQQRRVLPVTQVLLEAALALRVDVAAAAEEGEQDGEEDEGVGGGPEDEGDPDAEVVDFEDLLGG
jgi:hypothetical protein